MNGYSKGTSAIPLSVRQEAPLPADIPLEVRLVAPSPTDIPLGGEERGKPRVGKT